MNKSFSQRLSRKKPTNIQIVGASAKTYLQTRRSSSFYPVSGFSFIQPQKEPRTTSLIFQKKQTPNNSPWTSKLWSSNHSKIQRLAKNNWNTTRKACLYFISEHLNYIHFPQRILLSLIQRTKSVDQRPKKPAKGSSSLPSMTRTSLLLCLGSSRLSSYCFCIKSSLRFGNTMTSPGGGWSNLHVAPYLHAPVFI